MPIRFECPKCGQKLSVGVGKAGTSVECARCGKDVRVPDEVVDELLPSPNEAEATPEASAPFRAVHGRSSGPRTDDVVVLPRYVLYWQGALLALVGLIAFALGMVMGSTFVAQPSAKQEAIAVAGSVTFVSGPRSRPDAGAVVMLLPDLRGPSDEKLPIAGLRPSDPEPGQDSKSLTILQQLGGAYARVDSGGRWKVELPRRGRYWLLVISHDQTRPRTEREPKLADLRKLGIYFDRPEALLSDRRYVLRHESIRDEREIGVQFE